MPQVDLNFYQLLGYGASLICILLLLSLNDRRYGTQIDNIWYIIFFCVTVDTFPVCQKKSKNSGSGSFGGKLDSAYFVCTVASSIYI